MSVLRGAFRVEGRKRWLIAVTLTLSGITVPGRSSVGLVNTIVLHEISLGSESVRGGNYWRWTM